MNIIDEMIGKPILELQKQILGIKTVIVDQFPSTTCVSVNGENPHDFELLNEPLFGDDPDISCSRCGQAPASEFEAQEVLDRYYDDKAHTSMEMEGQD